MIEYLEQSLSPAITEKITRHLNECGECSRLFDRQERFGVFFKDVMTRKTADLRFTPSIDLEAVKQIDKPRKKKFSLPVFPRLSGLRLKPALAVLIVGFIMGFLFHSFFNFFFTGTVKQEQPGETAAKIQPVDDLQKVLLAHFEDVKPVIIEYAACTADPAVGEDLLPGKDIIIRLLKRNRILKNRVPLHKKEQLGQLLDELEIILTKIANLDEDSDQNREIDSCSSIKQLIKEKGILFKLEVSDSGDEASLTI
jgi:hypothetical protein